MSPEICFQCGSRVLRSETFSRPSYDPLMSLFFSYASSFIRETNVPEIRLQYRKEVLEAEKNLLDANAKTGAGTGMGAPSSGSTAAANAHITTAMSRLNITNVPGPGPFPSMPSSGSGGMEQVGRPTFCSACNCQCPCHATAPSS